MAVAHAEQSTPPPEAAADGDTNHPSGHPRTLAHAAELEWRSAAESAAIDAREVASGACPSDVREPPIGRCGGAVSLLEQVRDG